MTIHNVKIHTYESIDSRYCISPSPVIANHSFVSKINQILDVFFSIHENITK